MSIEHATVAVTDEQLEEAEEVVAPARRSSPLLVAIMIANLVLLGALVWSNRNIAGGVDGVARAVGHATERTAALEKQMVALGGAQGELEQEVEALRSVVASRTEEDVLFLKIVLKKRDVDRDHARKVARLVHKYSRIYGEDPDLVLAIIAVESNFDPNAVSSAGAQGLMQVMPQWQQVLGIREDLRDPETSIKYGLQVLGFYRNMYRDLETALTAYNRGPGPVDAALNKGVSPHNRYAPAVLKVYEQLKGLLEA